MRSTPTKSTQKESTFLTGEITDTEKGLFLHYMCLKRVRNIIPFQCIIAKRVFSAKIANKSLFLCPKASFGPFRWPLSLSIFNRAHFPGVYLNTLINPRRIKFCVEIVLLATKIVSDRSNPTGKIQVISWGDSNIISLTLVPPCS